MPKPMLLAPALAAVLSGCVVAPNPIGDEPMKLKAEEWEGIWLTYFDDEPMALTIRVADPAKGEIEVAWIEEVKGQLVARSNDYQIRRTDDWVFASTKLEGEDHPDPESGEDWYGFFRIKNEDGVQITGWWPDWERIDDDLLRDGPAPYDYSYLRELEPEHMAMIMSTERPQFAWEQPMVLRRMTE